VLTGRFDGDAVGCCVFTYVKLSPIRKVTLLLNKSLFAFSMFLLRLEVTTVSFKGVDNSIRNVIADDNPSLTARKRRLREVVVMLHLMHPLDCSSVILTVHGLLVKLPQGTYFIIKA
jgi:hypothetical protein